MAGGLSREELAPRLVQKAQDDPDFRQRLLDNPRQVVEEHLGGEVPDYMEINVVEETPTRVYIVLPPETQRELSDEDLDSVAGGTGYHGDTAWRDAG